MNGHFLVDVYVPALGKHFDVRIPEDGTMYEISALVGAAVETVSSGEYQANDPMLCNKEGRYLNPAETAKACRLHNSSSLILV